jgi:hypothetical protein
VRAGIATAHATLRDEFELDAAATGAGAASVTKATASLAERCAACAAAAQLVAARAARAALVCATADARSEFDEVRDRVCFSFARPCVWRRIPTAQAV